MTLSNIAVLGLGNVGSLAAKLLHEADFNVTGYDIHPPREVLPVPVKNTDLASPKVLAAEFAGQDAVLSCLPFSLNAEVARAAHRAGIHYFDLTEDVPTTKAIIELAKSSKGLMAPQCGLAPGFIGIVGAAHIGMFDTCRSVKMRVGALPQHPTGLLGYAFNWSPAGVVNEYLNDCEVIEEGVHKWVSPMEWKEKIFIDGLELEAFTTSGGLGTMCETYLGKVANIDYKTMRYPGHMELMNFFFHELLMREDRDQAGKILVHAKPPVNDDVVYVHVAAEGEIDGHMRRREFVRGYKPIDIAGSQQTAIAWTTAGSVVAVIEMVRAGTLPNRGFLKQEDIRLEDFLVTKTGSLYT